MSSMTERLGTLGFITQSTNPENCRSDILDLTPSGRAKLKDVQKIWQATDDLIEAMLGPNKTEKLSNLTLELRDALGGLVTDP